jgi:hypothetical protein
MNKNVVEKVQSVIQQWEFPKPLERPKTAATSLTLVLSV